MPKATKVPATPGDEERTMLFSSVKHSEPAQCVQLAQNPSVHIYYALKLKIEQSAALWLSEFLELDGLGSLLDSLVHLSNQTFTNFSDAILQLDCIGCVRTVLNARLGMQYCIQQEDYVQKLIKALDTNNTLPKKHIFELLTAVCVFSQLGHLRVVKGLAEFKKSAGLLNRFSIIVNQLKAADVVPYKITLMSFINAIISTTQDLKARARIRNEFIGLQVLDIISFMRREDKDPQLAVQCQFFLEQKQKDDVLLGAEHKLDINSHQDVFFEIYRKVLGTPQSMELLAILQDLLFMESTSEHSTTLWHAASSAVHHVGSIPTKQESQAFLDNMEKLSKVTHRINKSQTKCKKASDPLSEFDDGDGFKDGVVAGGPGLNVRLCRKDSGISMQDSISPYDNVRRNYFRRQGSSRDSGRGSMRMASLKEESCTEVLPGVKPLKHVKPVKWVMVPVANAKCDQSLWAQSEDPGIRLDFTALEQEFVDSPSSNIDDEVGNYYDSYDDEVSILSGKQGMIINLFLSRLETSPEELVSFVEDGDDSMISLEALRYMQSIIPSQEEIIQLKAYKGPRIDLGQAEHFILQLTDLPDFRLQLAGLLFKSEFNTKFQKLKAAFQTLIHASREVLHQPALRDFMRVALQAGNFLNTNHSHVSHAYGIKLSSWLSLEEVHGRSVESNLLSQVVSAVEKRHEEVLLFTSDLSQLENAASHNLEELKTEVTELNTKLRKFLGQLSSAHQHVKDTFQFFVEDVKSNLQQLQDSIVTLRTYSHQMALYLCEDESTFALQPTLKQLHSFYKAVQKCRKDNAVQKQQKALADKQRKSLAEKCADNQAVRLFGKKIDACSSFIKPEIDKLVDQLIEEVHSGHVTANMGDELTTPTSEENPLGVSHITYIDPPHVVEESPLVLNPVRQCPNRKIYSDKMEAIIEPQYHHGNQMNSASFLNAENGKCKKTVSKQLFQENPPSPEVFSIKVYPRVQELAKTHRRAHSDMNNSQNPVQKWQQYEQEKYARQAKQPKKAQGEESLCPLASLALESDSGKTLSVNDVHKLKLDMDKVEPEKGKKKKKIGFFKRFSRALRPKNSEYNIQKQNQAGNKKEEFKKPDRMVLRAPLATMEDKENFDSFTENKPVKGQVLKNKAAEQTYRVKVIDGIGEVTAEQRYAIRVYQRFKSSNGGEN